MSWTDERVATLTKLWADGLSASQIAAEIVAVFAVQLHLADFFDCTTIRTLAKKIEASQKSDCPSIQKAEPLVL